MMNIDFLHNQIVRDTITEGFIESFNENLMPYLISEYGSSLECVQFYEDHLADGLRIDGEFFYPLTVVVSGRPFIRAIKWQVSNYRNYDKFNPFTYKGREPLEFELLDIVPECVLRAVEGRSIYSKEGDAMPILLTSSSPDKTFLVGKYSQTFMDLLAKGITDAIESEFAISGLATSGAVLELRFEPSTFMEHVVENKTYRRMLIKARGCGARDLFVKWERLDGAGNYTISDNVTEDEIAFSLAEDVPSKIKEREYRYLVSADVAEYQAKMSRKNITEWREMIRRVIKRGEVMLVDTSEIIVGAPLGEQAHEMTADVAEAPVDEVIREEEIVSELDSLVALLDSDITITDEENDGFDDDLTALLQSAIGITADANDTADESAEPEDEPIADECDLSDECAEIEEDYVAEDAPDTPLVEEEEIIPEEDTEPSTDVVVEEISVPMPDEARIRLEIEARVRAEMEERFREKERETEQLRLRLEEQLRLEEKERERVAELARARLAENERLERERLERERLENERLEAERLENERLEAERLRLEEERAREERERAENERLERERLERERLEKEKEATVAAEPEPVKYTSKTVKLFFKRPVKPDIANRIHEIILATIKYYHKENVYIKIKANFPDSTTLNLEFVKIPENEIPLLVNIIKVLGRSDLGITKASLD